MKRVVRADGLRIEYVLIQTNRRNVLIQALQGATPRVYAPKGVRLSDVDQLVRDNAKKIAEMREALKPTPLRDGDAVRVEGRERKVRLIRGVPRVTLTDAELTISALDPGNAEAARALARNYLSELALKRIRERLEIHAPAMGVEFGRVTVRAQRSRWGSCSSRHNLNFNWRLILAPPQCLDYVVVHELTHLKEFNHSPRFWKLVEERMPDYKIWKDYLKRNGQGLNF